MLYKFFLSASFVFLFISPAQAQVPKTEDAKTVLRNIKLDVSSPDDVIKELGKPVSDERDELDAEFLNPWMKIKKNEKVFRKLTYKNVGEAEKIYLRFYENKLVKITFDYRESKDKRFLASELPQKYAVDFVRVQSVLKDTKTSDFEGQKENTVPKVYPSIYAMMSVQPDVIYFAIVDNSSFKSLWRQLKAKPSKEMFPGFLAEMQVISRAIMNNQ